MIVSIDGCRPDILLRVDAPNVRRLMHEGSYSFWARTTAFCETLPSHTSMVTGVMPRKHEIEWNFDIPLARPVYPKFPTLFEIAHKHGYSTAIAVGKSKFSAWAKPGTLDYAFIPTSEKIEDDEVVDHAVEMIERHQPQVLFVHLPSNDNVGHAIGWGTPQQAKTVENADRLIGRLLAALEKVGVRDRTLIIITADHGGAGKSHVPDDPRARHIPWIASGPGIRKDLDLTTYQDLVINTEDTFATACHALHIPAGLGIDGKVVREAFTSSSELLSATK